MRETNDTLGIWRFSHFIRQNSCQSANAETDVYLHRWSTDENSDKDIVVYNGL